MKRFFEWIAEDPFWHILTICACLSLVNCTGLDMYKAWKKATTEVINEQKNNN